MKRIKMFMGLALACVVVAGCAQLNGWRKTEIAGMFAGGVAILEKLKVDTDEDSPTYGQEIVDLAYAPDINWQPGVWAQSMGATGQALRGGLREASDRFQITYNRNNLENDNDIDNNIDIDVPGGGHGPHGPPDDCCKEGNGDDCSH